MFIRPRYNRDGRLTNIVLCRTNGHVLVDEDITDWFPANERGIDIIKMCEEFYGVTPEWGSCLEE